MNTIPARNNSKSICLRFEPRLSESLDWLTVDFGTKLRSDAKCLFAATTPSWYCLVRQGVLRKSPVFWLRPGCENNFRLQLFAPKVLLSLDFRFAQRLFLPLLRFVRFVWKARAFAFSSSFADCTMTPVAALKQVTSLCHKKHRCTIPAPMEPCANFIHVDYACREWNAPAVLVFLVLSASRN